MELEFTRTEQKILDLLSDGLPHSRQNIHSCLWDDQSDISTVNVHLTHMRKQLRTINRDILCTRLNGVTTYTLVEPVRGK